MSTETPKTKRKRNGFNVEFTASGLRAFNGLCHFTGWTGKRVIERALILANKNRYNFVTNGRQLKGGEQ